MLEKWLYPDYWKTLVEADEWWERNTLDGNIERPDRRSRELRNGERSIEINITEEAGGVRTISFQNIHL